MVKVDENFYTLRCITCKSEFDGKELCTTCLKCGDPLEIIYNYEFIKRRLNVYALKTAPVSALKYLTFYPILNLEKIVSLNEGGTPLHHCRNLSTKYGIKNLYIKNEGANPTGVFKDRGTLVEVTKALELIENLPKLIAVQPNGCNVVVKALFDSKGQTVEVTDEEVLKTKQVLAKGEAILVEPSRALPIATVAKLSTKKFFKKDDIVVCIATGNNLKDPKSAIKILPDPPTIDPDMKEIDSYLEQKLPNIKRLKQVLN